MAEFQGLEFLSETTGTIIEVESNFAIEIKKEAIESKLTIAKKTWTIYPSLSIQPIHLDRPLKPNKKQLLRLLRRCGDKIRRITYGTITPVKNTQKNETSIFDIVIR